MLLHTSNVVTFSVKSSTCLFKISISPFNFFSDSDICSGSGSGGLSWTFSDVVALSCLFGKF